jgi:hypothetical protein
LITRDRRLMVKTVKDCGFFEGDEDESGEALNGFDG